MLELEDVSVDDVTDPFPVELVVVVEEAFNEEEVDAEVAGSDIADGV